MAEQRTAVTPYALVFSDDVGNRREKILEYVKKQLQKHELSCEFVKCKGSSDSALLVTAGFDCLAKQAESNHMEKQLENGYYRKFAVKDLSSFKGSDDRNNFFTPAEEGRLLHSVLQSVTYEPEILKGFDCVVEPDKCFLDALETYSTPAILETSYLVHEPKQLTKVNKQLLTSFFLRDQLISDVRDYFGEEVALYFAWMKFFGYFLCYSTIIGLVLYFLRPGGASIDNDPYVPLFSLFIVVWGVLFIIFWQRKCSNHTFAWHSYHISRKEELRAEFYGTLLPDPVTGKPRLYYPHWKRRLRYLLSLLITIPILLLGVLTMILSLNLNGYIIDKNSPIYVSYLAQFAEPGGWFAQDSPYFGYMLPVIGHSLVIFVINQLYSKIAQRCTDNENHRDVHSWHNSLIFKRVLFECADCYLPLFYIAFYQFNVVALRNEMIGLFYTDEVRRVMIETVIPTVIGVVKMLKSKTTKEDCQFLKDHVKDEYEQFDDYLEMVIQFGYITLFASAFPLASAVSLIFLWIELRSDLLKLLWTYRRPYPRREKDIGIWLTVMKAMVYIGILTNCFILGFSSEQMMQWLPWLFTRDAVDGDQVMALGSGRYVVLLVFAAEHLLFLVALMLEYMINTVPKKVRIGIAKQDYWSSHNKKD
ncbi:anoctamin-10-like isoform X2 [Dysidea avara]|uniref:anoctamin-10-like isoform X2 n=1 Tax=Dysidea avara TaxID=196820 RepID=UPI003327A1DF